MKFIVEGRSFDERREAIAFAEGQAKNLDRSVDVMVEVEVLKREARRSWLCRMHPPGVQRTIAAPLKQRRAAAGD